MSANKYSKLNQLGRNLPEELLVDAAWLEREGYYGSLRKKYLSSGWLEQPVRGVYRRSREPLLWEQAVISLQSMMHVPVSVGGRTALEMQGFAHYLSQSPAEVHLYSDAKLPGWVKNLPTNCKFVLHNRTRLFSKIFEVTTPDLHESNHLVEKLHLELGLRVLHWGQWNWPLVSSTSERGFLELLDELPKRETFHQVDMLAEGLTSLSPSRLQRLLESCKSVKVKRLFFFFADRHQHRWLSKINRQKIDMGKGKRMLVQDGKYDSRYQITIPKDFYAF